MRTNAGMGALAGWLLMPALVCAAQTAVTQSPSSTAVPAAPPSPPSTTVSPAQGVVLDRIVGVVNGDVILESDVDEEQRFEELVPYREPGAVFSRDKAIQRLIDRRLILQQAALEPEEEVTDKELDAQLARLRNDIPECKQYHCDTEEGWTKFLADRGFTVEEFRGLWKKRMELLRFIEVRFRNGIKISDEQIQAYYTNTMLPEYKRRNATAPELSTISKRIEEVLLQQEVGALLTDWLKSLRAQGSVKLMTPGEVTP